MRATIALVALSISVANPALADFRLLDTLAVPEVTPGGARAAPSSGEASAIVTAPLPPPEAPVSRFLVARGFGNNVPLGFAVRQIVPPSVRVTYGTDVDPSTPVDWRGGRPWNLVLGDAVKPLGLRLAVRRASVAITN